MATNSPTGADFNAPYNQEQANEKDASLTVNRYDEEGTPISKIIAFVRVNHTTQECIIEGFDEGEITQYDYEAVRDQLEDELKGYSVYPKTNPV